MSGNKGTTELAIGSWLAAFAVGTLAGTLLWILGGWSFLQASFVGLVVFVFVGLIVSLMMARPLPGPNEIKPMVAPSPVAPKAEATPVAAVTAKVPVAEKPAPAKPAPAKPAPKKAAAKKVAEAPAASDAAPAMMMDAPTGGQADDLKKITGVGPKLEQTLNDLGIWHYEQVAKLKKKDIAWVDERLRFKGRIERDDWVGQAKELAKAKG